MTMVCHKRLRMWLIPVRLFVGKLVEGGEKQVSNQSVHRSLL